jgi:hypothetical protein
MSRAQGKSAERKISSAAIADEVQMPQWFIKRLD